MCASVRKKRKNVERSCLLNLSVWRAKVINIETHRQRIKEQTKERKQQNVNVLIECRVSLDVVLATTTRFGKGKKADLRIRRNPLESKENCQGKEIVSPEISDKRGKANSEDRHMGEFQWILISFDGFCYMLGSSQNPLGAIGIYWDPESAFLPLRFGLAMGLTGQFHFVAKILISIQMCWSTNQTFHE